MTEFNYTEAFIRNIGWLTKDEQLALQTKKVAIAGLGGVGGTHLLTLTRLGIQHFSIADNDTFELKNFNRQVGATMTTIGQNKTEVLSKIAKDINPTLNLQLYPEGLSDNNIEKFLHGADIFIDALDFFALDIRDKVYKWCTKLRIPVTVAAPIGMSCAYLIYRPGGMTLMDYFNWEGLNEELKGYYFMVGLNPKLLCLKYLMDFKSVNVKEKIGPSVSMSCILTSGIVGVEVLKILLNRGKVYGLPYYHLFDPYLETYVRGYLFFGNKNPIQKLKLFYLKKRGT